MPKRIDLTGEIFGDWIVEEYDKESKWKCRNIETDEVKSIHSYSLRTQYSDYTKVDKKLPEDDLTGKTFGEWTVIEYLGKGRWKCKCSCGRDGKVSGTDLIQGKSLRCKNGIHNVKEDLTGKMFGNWKVLGYAGKMRWTCECQCEAKTVQDILRNTLVRGETHSCKKCRNCHIIRKDISGQTFGNIEVIGYTGADNMWRCKCLVCGNENFITHRDTIVNMKAKSCGCLKEQLRKQTLLERYGDTNTTRINNPRERWQIEALESKENLEKIINENPNITVTELAKMLSVNDTSITKALKKFGLAHIIKEYKGVSDAEISLRNFIESFGYEIETSNRKILNGKELDIYIPELKVAIEFNGNFWHSHIFKDSKYHQEKSIKCREQGIRLIHIFEYEWRNAETQEKLKQYISNILNKENKVVYARNTTIKHIDSTVTKEFLNKYHLQGYASASINLGCYDNQTHELLGLMTLGTPRFNTDADYEIIRLCWKTSIKVIGGTEKLFKAFIEKYNPTSILTYADFSKFAGQIYKRLGFKEIEVSKPGYVWVSKHENRILQRYQTQKHKLLDQGLGKFGNTEDEIMENLDYFKVYNSGNLKFIWTSDNNK